MSKYFKGTLHGRKRKICYNDRELLPIRKKKGRATYHRIVWGNSCKGDNRANI